MSRPETRSEPSRTDAQDLLLARAALCRFLRLALAPPDRASHETLRSPATLTALDLAARTLDRSPDGELLAASEALVADPGRSIGEARSAHRRLFGHTLRGRVCPYECEYGRRPLLQQAQELADLAGFYRAFGLRPSRLRHERPDHVACELEFLEFLSVKEALALERRDGESGEITRQAVRRLLREHLGRFGRAFARALAEARAGELPRPPGSPARGLSGRRVRAPGGAAGTRDDGAARRGPGPDADGLRRRRRAGAARR